MRNRSPFASSAVLSARRNFFARAAALLILLSTGTLGGCFPNGGGHHGEGPNNAVIDLTIDVTVNNQPDSPNLTFTDGTSATLHFAISNSGNKPSDQTITVTVTLPSGLTFVSFASVTPGSWTCSESGQMITCNSSSSVPGLTNAMPIFTISVNVASNASGNAQLSASTSTPDGSPSTSSGAKGVIFNAPTPSISSLNPTSGFAGTAVTISGSNFGASQGSSAVTFNGVNATIASWSATSIVADVPTGATTGNVVVTVDGIASNGINFVVSGPQITSLNPTSGPFGTAVTILGSNFGSSQGSSTVSFNGTNATTITTWSATSIVADVPTGATTGKVAVTVGGAVSNGVNFTVTASGCTSGGNAASLLAGDYAFREQGFLVSSGAFVVFAGRFHADGVNTISNGLIEYNSLDSVSSNDTPVAFTGCFSLSSASPSEDPALGTMTMVNSLAGLNYMISIAVRTNGDGNFINFDFPQIVRGAGNFEKQCPNATNATCPAFSNSNISADYGLAFDGFNTRNATANVSSVGRFTASAQSLNNAVIDISTSGGVVALNDAFSGSYNVTDTANGRVKITADVTYNNGTETGAAETLDLGCYLAAVNSSGTATALYCLGLDTGTTSLPLLSGRIVSQNTPAGGWTTANAVPASNASVIWSTGINGSGSPRVDVGQLTYNTSASPATVTVNQDENNGGSYTFQQITEDITVASNGRLEATVSGSLVAPCYMLDAGNAFCISEANNASLDFVVPQEAEPSGGFTAADFQNSFAFATLLPMTTGVSDLVGLVTSDNSSGTLTGSEYLNEASGVTTPNVSGSYMIASGSDAPIGRVTITQTLPSVDTVMLYIIDANTAVAISTTDPNPAVIYFHH
jgi:IPT/TIG domain